MDLCLGVISKKMDKAILRTGKSTILETYNMFNCDKAKNNEVQGYLFFTPMSRSGTIFFALALESSQRSIDHGQANGPDIGR